MNRGRLLPILKEARRFVHELSIGHAPSFRYRIHRGTPLRTHLSFWRRADCQQHRIENLVQVPPCNLRVAITVSDYLALLGHLDTPLHRIGWRRQDRLIGGAAPAPDTAPASVKQFQPDALLSGQTRQRLLRSV